METQIELSKSIGPDLGTVIKEKRKGSPKISEVIFNAKTLIKHSEVNLAINLLRVACNYDSKNIVLLSFLAETLELVQNYNEALIIRKYISKAEHGFEQLNQLATLYYKMNKDEEAMNAYYEALSLLTFPSESLFETYKNLGNILVKQGDFEGAEELYNKANTINSKSDILLVNYGTLEVQRNDFDKSLYCFREAVKINPDNDKAWIGLAMVHNQFGDVELAWANVETALDINPANKTGIVLASQWAHRDKKYQKVIEKIQKYLSEVPEDEEISLVLVNFYCALGDLDRAQLVVRKLILLNPENSDYLNILNQIKK